MSLSLDDSRRLEYLLTLERNNALTSGEEDELRHILARQDPNVTLMPWGEMVAFGRALLGGGLVLR
jgi:hypothetical protein